MNYKIGFIGCGNMASAIIQGIIDKTDVNREQIVISDVSKDAEIKAVERIGVKASNSLDPKERNVYVATNSDVIFVAVKPQFYQCVLEEIKDVLSSDQIIVTIAPGKTISWLESILGDAVKLVRTMPNTPALVGEGVTGVCKNANVSDEDFTYIMTLLSSFGMAEEIPENLMDVCVSVSGSSPAYVFMFIEAMADAAVADGMPRDKAYKFAAQAVLGSAKMVLETGKHPGELKDMVCSPGGTTIEAVRVLEDKGFRSSVIEAMKACTAKAKGL